MDDAVFGSYYTALGIKPPSENIPIYEHITQGLAATKKEAIIQKYNTIATIMGMDEITTVSSSIASISNKIAKYERRRIK
jgi:hypothetical protein